MAQNCKFACVKKCMKLTGLLSFLFYSTMLVHAQTGNITITDNAGATELVNKHIYFNTEHSKLPGWRIQLFSTNSLLDAQQAKSSFLAQYDDIQAEVIFEAPNYKLRIGNYHSRFDANRDLQLVLVDYPNAFICKDMIKINDE